MEKHKYTGKTKAEAISNATAALNELESNLIINEIGNTKGGLFKNSKVEIEIIEKREVTKYIKDYLIKLLKDLGFNAQVELKNREETPKFMIYADDNALIIGRNGRNLKALLNYTSAHIQKEISQPYKFTIDVNDYNKKREIRIERLAKKTAREVAATKIEAKLDSMNSYERRIIHNVLTNNKKVYTESEGEEPNRYVVIKPRED